MWCAHKQSCNCVQREDEDIKKHCDGFKNQVEVIENCGGELGTEAKLFEQDDVHKNSDSDEKNKPENMAAVKERNREKHLAFGSSENCDKKRFGNLTEDSDNNCTFGDNKCPETQQKACEYLMNCEKFKP